MDDAQCACRLVGACSAIMERTLTVFLENDMLDLRIAALLESYRLGNLRPREVLLTLRERALAETERHAWIRVLTEAELEPYLARLEASPQPPDHTLLPLFGIPFAIKDNIDLAQIPTTAGCPAFAYLPEESAFVVQRLLDLGAVPLGKTNLDQFATGLVGTRSPYGICRNALQPEYLAGGSSSGSAVAVALGQVSFALGTDTAGSGRVPAAFNNLIGVKPTRGLLSARGVVPACRSLDTISLFTLDVPDAARLLEVLAVFDADDAYARPAPGHGTSGPAADRTTPHGFLPPPGDPPNGEVPSAETSSAAVPPLETPTAETPSAAVPPLETPSAETPPAAVPPLETPTAPGPGSAVAFRFGVPPAEQLDFLAFPEYAELFAATVTRLQALGGEPRIIDCSPFLEAARLLYEGPWVAERYAAIRPFLEAQPESLWPVTHAIIAPARTLGAVETFAAQYRLAELRRASESAWTQVDCLLLPTANQLPSVAEEQREPVRINQQLGRYTNFMNLLDLCAIAVPAGFCGRGLPFGVTLCAPAFHESTLWPIADRLHRASVQRLGAMTIGHRPVTVTAGIGLTAAGPTDSSACMEAPARTASTGRTDSSGANLLSLVVCGAHMRGLALNEQLTERGGYFVGEVHSAPEYRFYALPGGPPQRPGMLRVREGGVRILMEHWQIPAEHVGSFVVAIPAPLGIGRVRLDDGREMSGFLCEAIAVEQAEDISHLGSWRRYLQSVATSDR
jgi:allophanate hydrolase